MPEPETVIAPVVEEVQPAKDNMEDFTISEEEVLQSPGGGKDEGANADTPAPEQTAGDGKEPDEKVQAPSGDAGQEPVNAEALKESLSFAKSPEEKQESIKSQLSASSRESRWNKSVIDSVKDSLEKQGIELSVDRIKNDSNEEVPNIALSVQKGYKPDADGFNYDFSKLSDEKQEKFLDEPQKLVDDVVGKAKLAYARVLPAGEIKPQIEQDRIDAAIEVMTKRTDADGTGLYPDFADNREYVEAMLGDPTMSDGMKALLAKDPETGLELLNSRVAYVRNRLISKAEKAQKAKADKEKKANQDASTMPANSGMQKETGPKGNDPFAEYLVD